ncbi:MAG: rhomboid family intramembrane serine protease [Thermoanaerobaculales bacterium]|jgi:membrane associated rhomboid family serine protease|nr:rhomboid family intramembrane serine protease [Thermoanaerobaculales bacterium]
MLLPIGSDQTTVRRMPWVTLAIMALCVAMYIFTLVAPGDEGAIVEAEIRALEYHADHPYLELEPQLKGYLYYQLRQREGEDPPRPADDELVRSEQVELDVLTAQYFEARDALPFWRWGLVPADMKVTALFTHAFIHAGILHLLGNLFFLYLVGPAVEDAWGRPLFLAFYLASAAVAALVFAARYPGLNEPLIGASGAVAGVMGAFAVRYWDSRITFFYFVWMIRIYQGTFAAPAWIMLGLWALGELAFAMGVWAFFSVADLGDVGFLAHVGGFVFGVGFAFLVGRVGFEERFVEPVIERGETVHDASAVEECLALERRGRIEEALRGLEAALQADPGDADAAAALWNTAVRSECPSRALPAVVAAVEVAARRGDTSLPAQVWAEMLRSSPELAVDLRTATRVAELLEKEGLDGDVEQSLVWLAGRVDSSTPEGLLVRLARIADRLAVPAPFAALALEKPDLSPELRDELHAGVRA